MYRHIDTSAIHRMVKNAYPEFDDLRVALYSAGIETSMRNRTLADMLMLRDRGIDPRSCKIVGFVRNKPNDVYSLATFNHKILN